MLKIMSRMAPDFIVKQLGSRWLGCLRRPAAYERLKPMEKQIAAVHEPVCRVDPGNFNASHSNPRSAHLSIRAARAVTRRLPPSIGTEVIEG